MLRLLSMFCVLAFALALPAQANKPSKDAEKAWSEGAKTYKAGDMVTTRGHFGRACDGGHARACFNLGVMLSDGIGGAADLPAACQRLSRACDLGWAAGCYNFGNMAMEARGGGRDDTQARMAHERACREGIAQACNSLAILFESGRGGRADLARAKQLYQTACDGGASTACDNLRKVATGTPLAPPSTAGLSQADYRMGLDSFNRRLYPGAYQLLRPFADSGDTPSEYAVGWMLAYGEGTQRDYLEAARFLVRAARKGDKGAEEVLARIAPNIRQAEFVYMIDTQGPDMTSLQTFGYDVAVYCQYRGPHCSTWRQRYKKAENENNRRAFAEQMARAWEPLTRPRPGFGNDPRRSDETFGACIARQARTRGVTAGTTVLDFDCY